MSRALSGTAFAVAALAFMLPFGVVSSCSGAEVRYTGAELATFSVPAQDAQDVELRDSLEHGAGAFALAALVAAGFGVVLSILGRPVGAGVCAALGLVAIQLLVYATVAIADGGELFVGYWLSLLALVVSAGVCLIRQIGIRRQRRRSVWLPIGCAVAVVLPPLGLVVSGSVALVVVVTRTLRRGFDPRPSAY